MKRNQRSGISLLETMISLAVMALIALTLSSGLNGASKVLHSSVGVTASVDQALARHELRQWVERALTTAFPGQSKGGMSGQTDQLHFSFVSDAGPFWAGDAVEVSVQLDSAENIILTAVGSTDESGKTFESIEPLVGPNGDLQIAYFGRLSPDDPKEWLDHWLPEAGLPDLIRLSMTTTSANVPPLTIRPGKALAQSEMSLSSLLPPSLPSRP